MIELNVQLVVFLLAVGLYTVAAAIWDIRIKKIPNKLTLPTLGLGIVYQAVFNQWAGLLDGGLAFLVGFGMLLVLWMIGGGGGGDVKLIGALSMWLGFSVTWKVLLVSSAFAMMGTFFVIVYSALTRGVMNTKDKYTATGKTPKGQKPEKETIQQRTNRRAMGFAVPVALATWAVVAYYLPQFPWLEEPVAAVAGVTPAPAE